MGEESQGLRGTPSVKLWVNTHFLKEFFLQECWTPFFPLSERVEYNKESPCHSVFVLQINYPLFNCFGATNWNSHVVQLLYYFNTVPGTEDKTNSKKRSFRVHSIHMEMDTMITEA